MSDNNPYDFKIGDEVYSTYHREFLTIENIDNIYTQCGTYCFYTPHLKGLAPYIFHKDALTFDNDGNIINIDYNYRPTRKPKQVYNFKPFDKVLVRDTDDDIWRANIFSNLCDDITHIYNCVFGVWQSCIPFNEKTKYLLGTTNNWEE